MRIGPIVLACVLFAPAAARADLTDFEVEWVTLDANGDIDEFLSDLDLEEFFGNAACVCDENFRIAIRVKKKTAPAAGDRDTQLELWSGEACNDTSATNDRDNKCKELSTSTAANPHDLQSVYERQTLFELDLPLMMFPDSDAPPCGIVEDAQPTLWLLANTDTGTQDPEIAESFGPIQVDTSPPPQVGDVTAKGVEDGVSITWENPDTDEDTEGFQVLCRVKGSSTPLFDHDEEDAEYKSTARICGSEEGPTTPDAGPVEPADAGVPPDAGATPDAASAEPDAAVADIDAGAAAGDFDSLDPRFLCSGLIAVGSDDYRVDLSGLDLAGDVTIESVLIQFDRQGNFNVYQLPDTTPAPVIDFWETYEDAGGQAEGGHCFIATAAYGDYDDPSVRILRRFRDESLAQTALGRRFIAWYYEHSPAAAEMIRSDPALRARVRTLLAPLVFLVWLHQVPVPAPLVALLSIAMAFLALRGALRRRRRLTAVLAGLSLAVLGVSSAAAQPIPVDEDPYWAEGGEDGTDGLVQQPSHWAFELKFGPYTPDIAGEGLSYDPWEAMYGGPAFLTQLELDRYFLWPRGMLGVGVNVGYMQKSADSFMDGQDPSDPDAMRSGDENTFHLVPTSVSAIYRFTMLADETPVPLVPYAKLGLSYYFWWATKGNGDVSNTPTNGDASGGTLGWQGTIGLSFRVDGIDPDGTADLRGEAGVEHIGLFFEVTYADVSGLGMDRKLHVGSAFWSAGLNFEW